MCAESGTIKALYVYLFRRTKTTAERFQTPTHTLALISIILSFLGKGEEILDENGNLFTLENFLLGLL